MLNFEVDLVVVVAAVAGVGDDVDHVGVRVGGPGSGGTKVGFGVDPPERSGVGMDEAAVSGSGLAEVSEPLRGLPS
jgi:hypothetical protein